MTKAEKRVLIGGFLLGLLIYGYHIIREQRVIDNPYTEQGEIKPGWGAWI